MRIFSREEFMKLPAGTIFCKGKEWYFTSIDVKGNTINAMGKNIDFYVHGINWIDAHGTIEAIDKLSDMRDNASSYPMQNSIQRDGMFDDEDIFLVYELDDLLRLKEFIENAIHQSS